LAPVGHTIDMVQRQMHHAIDPLKDVVAMREGHDAVERFASVVIAGLNFVKNQRIDLSSRAVAWLARTLPQTHRPHRR